ncbi:MAG: VOC family protein [Phycisphaerales bacterium]|nr:MAG: VOC family protein [Phycisphaerales bacterium]
MKFNGVNHLAMVTGDMDAMIRFWRDLLGMRLVGGLGERRIYTGAGSELYQGKKQ